MQEIHASLHAARQRGVEDALAPVAAEVASSLRLLAFDEMQITDITDAMIVGRLFEALFAAGVVIVTTSNRVPDDLYKNGLNRQLFLPFIDLIKERMVVWELTSPTDYRQNRLAGAPVYFTPTGPAARAAIACSLERSVRRAGRSAGACGSTGARWRSPSSATAWRGPASMTFAASCWARPTTWRLPMR